MLKMSSCTKELIARRRKRGKEWTAQENARIKVIKLAIKLAHNAHKQTHGNMLSDERALYNAVLKMERLNGDR